MVVDIIAIIFLVTFTITGYNKGLVFTLINTFSFVFSLVITAIFYKGLTNFLSKTILADYLHEKIHNAVSTVLLTKSETTASDMGLPKILLKGISESAVLKDFANVLTQNILNAVLTLITVIVLIVLIRLILIMIKGPLKAITSLPIIKQVNKFAGAVLGVGVGVFWLYVIVALVGIFSFSPGVEKIAFYINSSTLLQMLYNNNILLFLSF